MKRTLIAAVTAGGGHLTTSNELAAGRLTLVTNSTPGQGAIKSGFRPRHGAALPVNRVENLSASVQQQLGSPTLRAMARAAKALGRTHSALAICRAAMEQLED